MTTLQRYYNTYFLPALHACLHHDDNGADTAKEPICHTLISYSEVKSVTYRYITVSYLL
jgi:hypothetical protein